MSWLANIVGGVAGLAGDVLSPLLANRQNRGAQDDAQRFEEHMWNLNNEYNHPTQQIARLKEAGLNPHLSFGSPTVAGNATLGGGAGAPGGSGGNLNLNNTLKMIEIFSELKNKRAQTEVLQAEKQLKKELSEETKEKVKNLSKATQLLETDRQLKLGSQILQELDIQKSYIPKKMLGAGNRLFDRLTNRNSEETKKRFKEMDLFFQNMQKEIDNSPKHSDREFFKTAWKKIKEKIIK